MTLKKPTSMDECVYFTRRTLEPSGRLTAWTFKKSCPECKTGVMGKPIAKGKVRIRANEYVCRSCNYSEEKFEHEATLTVNIEYTCPHCGKDGEATTPYKRKTFQGVPSFIFTCNDCGEKIGISKKMKKPKKKKPKKT